MATFNSLGSNYNFGYALKSLLATNDGKHHKQLKNFLEKKYQGKATLVYKGREALRLALRASSLKDVTVAICGFTCFAVYDAVVKEGYKAEYLDIEKDFLNFSFETLKKHVEKNPEIKIVIIQNTLGMPCDIEKIAKFCKEKNLILIEDLAHSIGTVYKNNHEAGMVGDFTVLSFSQDKVVDGISGGALIIRNHELGIMNHDFDQIKFNKQIIDRLYPLFTYLIRKSYRFGVGKVLHFILKKFGLLSNPMSDSGNIYGLPNWYCKLIYNEFFNLDKNLNYRKRIAEIYNSSLRGGTTKQSYLRLFRLTRDDVNRSTNLRFPILVENREKLIKYLKCNNIFVSDIWYDAPIAPKKYLHKTNYTNQCPVSEDVSSKILNLPTHRNVSEKDAEMIVKRINEWILDKPE